MPPSRVVTLALIAVVLLAAAAGVYVVTRMDTTSVGKPFPAGPNEPQPTDPALITYREAAQVPTEFKDPRGLAVGPEDRIYVAGDQAVRVFTSADTREPDIKIEGSPRCLAVASDGTLYVGLQDHVRVCKPDGTVQADWEGLGKDAVLTCISVTADNVIVSDAGDRVVLLYDTAGKLLRRIGRKDPAKNIPGLVLPSAYLDAVVAPDGLIRVTNTGLRRVEAYTLDGDLEHSWGHSSSDIAGFCGCCNPTNLAVLPDGRIVTSEKGLPRVKIYSSQGEFECVVAGIESFPDGRCHTADCSQGKPLPLAADSRGRILVLDPVSCNVRIFVRKEGAGK